MSDQNSTGRSSPIAQSQLVEFIHLIYSSSLEQLRLVQHSLGKGEQSVYSYNQAYKLHSPIIVGLHTLLHCAMSTVLTLVVVEDRKKQVLQKCPKCEEVVNLHIQVISKSFDIYTVVGESDCIFHLCFMNCQQEFTYSQIHMMHFKLRLHFIFHIKIKLKQI